MDASRAIYDAIIGGDGTNRTREQARLGKDAATGHDNCGWRLSKVICFCNIDREFIEREFVKPIESSEKIVQNRHKR
ncbi:MAG: hypothetical protein MUP16_10440 [Sedimentisphaerales bacterium]|nr:hypothetical protein [Sedimentisphaerales bacterium]